MPNIPFAKPCYFCPNRQSGFCQTLFQECVEKLDCNVIFQKSLSVKEYVFRQGESYDGLFIVQSGWIQLTRLNINKRRQVLRSVLPGEIFGFKTIDHDSVTQTAIAAMDSVICKIPKAIELCSLHSELSMSLAWVILYDKLLIEKYLAKICQYNATEQIAFMVLELFRRLKIRNLNKDNVIPFPLKQEDIADMLGLTTIHVNRILQIFRKEGIFIIQKQELSILNYEALHRLAGAEFDDMFQEFEHPCDR